MAFIRIKIPRLLIEHGRVPSDPSAHTDTSMIVSAIHERQDHDPHEHSIRRALLDTRTVLPSPCYDQKQGSRSPPRAGQDLGETGTNRCPGPHSGSPGQNVSNSAITPFAIVKPVRDLPIGETAVECDSLRAGPLGSGSGPPARHSPTIRHSSLSPSRSRRFQNAL